ncbi:poly(glycerol-phosphate) alpha-glucosyltransferase [Lentilactobacillus fungorum]|uniref:Poly(Glycerol-phosphate) alpha-glucosyltransferase n=1 Tax=Lentilactobacillus fungorum TaxID=2201250 RepID=A0ABQ3W483_9LACO|nr:glycosyltransferase [Lentilactobacillus fungorum]GHP15091.1 poly(glycerol-phosphate) alpha-glucosyltransferase [Lentilactobacillus fungorum]
MYYFLNTTINIKNSGIGHAQLKRFALFKKYGQPAKLLTTNYNRDLPVALKYHGIDKNQSVNLFDFFGGTEDVEFKNFEIKDLNLPDDFEIRKSEDHFDGLENGQIIMRITMRKDNPKCIDSLMYFDSAKRVVEVDWWDPRGFKAQQQFFDKKGKIRVERLLNDQGKVYFESFQFAKKFDTVNKTLYRLVDYKGYDRDFDGFKNLARYFFDELSKRDQTQDENDIIISDAGYELSWPLLHMEQPAFRVMQLHNNHTNDPVDYMNSDLNFNYEYPLDNFKKWQGVIAPTQTQVDHVQARFGTKPKTYLISVGIVPDAVMERPKQDFNKRIDGKIVQIARLSHEKRIDHAVKAIAKAVKKVPNITLDIYGYANDDSGDKAKKLVDQLGLKKVISFKGYVNDINKVYDEAQLSILTSTAEGLPLSLIEAQSHGVPLASYDVHYGPRDVINNGKDGYLVKSGDIDGMADAIVKIMSDDKLRKQFSDTAYESRKKYSEDNVWKQWQTLDKDATNYFKALRKGD